MSIDGSESVTGSGMIGENEQEKKMQVCKAVYIESLSLSISRPFYG